MPDRRRTPGRPPTGHTTLSGWHRCDRFEHRRGVARLALRLPRARAPCAALARSRAGPGFKSGGALRAPAAPEPPAARETIAVSLEELGHLLLPRVENRQAVEHREPTGDTGIFEPPSHVGERLVKGLA